MAILIVDEATYANAVVAISGPNGTRESSLINAITTAFLGDNVTIELLDVNNVLLYSLVKSPFVANLSSTPKTLTVSGFVSGSFYSNGIPVKALWKNSNNTTILSSTAGVGTGDISLLSGIVENVPVSGGDIILYVSPDLDTSTILSEAKYRNNQTYLFSDILVDTPLIYTSGTFAETPPRVTVSGDKDPFNWGVYGPTYNKVCVKSEWSWSNPGGDWVNLLGNAQETTNPHFSFSANAVTTGAYEYSVDALAAITSVFTSNRWAAFIVKRSGGTRSLASQHHSSLPAPRIDVTYSDGTTASLACVACIRLTDSTAYSLAGLEEAVINQSVALEFERPAKQVTSATLVITVTGHTATACTINGYLANPPLTENTVVNGVASAYVVDTNLRSDSSILFSHTYEDGSTLDDWVVSNIGEVNVFNTSLWSPDLFGLGVEDLTRLPTAYAGTQLSGKWFLKSGSSSFSSNVSLVSSSYTGNNFEPIASGIGALKIVTPKANGVDGAEYPATGSLGCDLWTLFNKDVSGLLDEIYVRFYARIASSPKRLADTKMYRQTGEPAEYQIKKGKWGVGAHHWSFFGGNNGVGGENLGWTNRLAHTEAPADMPLEGFHSGVHSYDMLPSGQDMMWGKDGGMGASFYPDKWYCIEVRCKLNTWNASGGSPSDGIMEAWVDGVKVSSHTGWSYRDGPLDYVTTTPPASGLPPFRRLGPIGLLINHYQGGVVPCDEDTIIFLSLIASGTSYIGPANFSSVTLPSWLATKATFEVTSVPNSNITDSSYNTVRATAYHGTINNIVDAWGGACVRQSSSDYIIHGGGHQDYAGNEIYSLRLSETPTWVRKWGPTPSSLFQNNLNSGVYPDGNPSAIHTYMGLVYQQSEDRLLRPGRTSYASSPVAYVECDAWKWSESNNLYNTPANNTSGYWHTRAIQDRPIAPSQSPSFIAQDSTTGDIYAVFDTSLYKYSRSSNTWSLVSISGPSWRGGVLCFSSVYNTLVGFNNHSNPSPGAVLLVDFTAGTRTNVALNGNSSGITAMTRDDGFDYAGAVEDPITGLIYFWPRTGGNTIYSLNLSTMAVVAIPLTGETLTSPVHGPCGRLQFVNNLNSIVVLPAWDSSVYLFKVR